MAYRVGRKPGRGFVPLRVAGGISRIDLMILGFLLERPMHGYEINQILSSDEMQSWVNLGRTTTYYSLAKLKKEGLVEEIVERQEDKPEKNVYHVTEKGREEFFNALSQMLASTERLYFDYNVGLFFVNRLVRDKASEALKARLQFLEGWLIELKESMEEEKQLLPMTWKAVTEHTQVLVQREVEWLGKFIEEVEGKAKETFKEREPGATEEEYTVMTLRGDIKEFVLSDIVHLIEVGGYTGTLYLKKDNLVRKVSFAKGEANQVSSSSHLPSGEVATAEEESHILKDLYECFEWTSGTYVFQPDKLIEQNGIPVTLTNHDIILGGCRRVEEWPKIGKIISSSGMVFESPGSVEEVARKLTTLRPKEEKVLAEINGLRDVDDLAERCELSMFETSKILYCLTLTGLLSIVSSEKARTLKLLKHFWKLSRDAMRAIAGEKTAAAVEREINEKAEALSLPFAAVKGVVEDKVAAPIELDALVEMERSYLALQFDVVAGELGSAFVQQLIKGAVDKLTPEMNEQFRRYGFDKVAIKG